MRAADPILAAPPGPASGAARAGWAGPGALRALGGGGAGRVAVALTDGGYVELAGGWVLVAPARAPVGPLSVLATGLPRRPFAAGERADVAGDTLVVGSVRIDLRGVRALRRRRPPPRAADVEPALAAALAGRPCPLPDLRAGLDALRGGDHAAAVALLAGRGPGLTPAGDDVLAGYAAWRHAEGAGAGGVLSATAEGRSAPLGLAYLRCGERGELPQVAEAVLRAVWRGDAGAAARHTGALERWGATSGTALLWGFAAAARGVHSGGLAAAPTMVRR
ncbi:MAG: hypothetical protein QOD81_3478 [Solirubrobacteraceae bacterium]|nr:hypothetical protein [Solirubrobacteraceae bacterium]